MSGVAEILRKDADVYDRKRADYSPGDDPFENFKFAAKFAARVCDGIPLDDQRRAAATLVGLKISRLMTVGLTGDPKNEGVLDTFGDDRVYNAILETMHREAAVETRDTSREANITPDSWLHHKPLSAETLAARTGTMKMKLPTVPSVPVAGALVG